jgi:hypothetical protein
MKFVEMVILHSSLSTVSTVVVDASSGASAQCKLLISVGKATDSPSSQLDRHVAVNERLLMIASRKRRAECRYDLRPSLIGICRESLVRIADEPCCEKSPRASCSANCGATVRRLFNNTKGGTASAAWSIPEKRFFTEAVSLPSGVMSTAGELTMSGFSMINLPIES